MYEKKERDKEDMLKFIVVASLVILFLVFSIPLLIWRKRTCRAFMWFRRCSGCSSRSPEYILQ